MNLIDEKARSNSLSLPLLIMVLLFAASGSRAEASALDKVKKAMGKLEMAIEHKEETKADEDGKKPPFKTETWIFDCGAARPTIHYRRFLNSPPHYDGNHPSLINSDMGIGFDGGAFGYWYHQNCIRILLDRKDVIARQTASRIESRSDQWGYLRFTWELDDGNQLQLSFAVPDDGHAIYARVDLQGPSAAKTFDDSLDLQMTCYPGGFGPFYNQPSHRCVQTAKARNEVPQDHAGNEFPSVPVTVGESWVFYADKLARSESLGLVFVPSEKLTGEVKMSGYGQNTTLHYPPQTTSCRMAFFAYELDMDEAWETFSKMDGKELATLKTMRFWPEEK